MKKFFSFTFAFLLMVSMISLVGCNGLWDFDDDDDVTLAPINFKVGGNVVVPSNKLTAPNLRAAIAADDLEIAAYKFDPDTGSESKILESVTGVASDGSFIVEFSDYGGYFILQTRTSDDQMELSLYLEGLSRGNSEIDTAMVNATSTAQVLLLEQAYMNTGKIISLSDLDSTDVDTVAGIVNTTLSKGDIDDATVTIAANSISINNKDSISSMVVDEKETLTATIEPSYATATVSWTSSDTSVASITDGVLTALAEGTAVVKVTAGSVTDTITIEVVKEEKPIQSISITGNVSELEVGETANLTAVLDPTDTTDSDVTWTSSNAAVNVTKTGNLTATIEGKTVISTPVTITATAGDKSATFSLTVKEATITPVTIDLGATYSTNSTDYQIWVENFGSADLTGLVSSVSKNDTTYPLKKDTGFSSSTLYVLTVDLPEGETFATFDVSQVVLSGATVPSDSVVKVFTDSGAAKVEHTVE